MPKPGSGQALVRMFGSSVNPVNVVLVEPICEDSGVRGDHWQRHRGVIVAVGEKCNLMYVSKADVTDSCKRLWIRTSQSCALRVRTRGVSVTTLLKR